ncbi:MAG: hypothetical protein ABIF12_02760 [bacterium]
MKMLKIFFLLLTFFCFLKPMSWPPVENGRDHLDYIDDMRKKLGKEPIGFDFYNKAGGKRIIDDEVKAFDNFFILSLSKKDEDNIFYINESQYRLGGLIQSPNYAEFVKWILVSSLTDSLESEDFLPKNALKELDDFVLSVLCRNEEIVKNALWEKLDLEEKKIMVYVYILIFAEYWNYADELYFAYHLCSKNEGLHIIINEKTKISLKSWIKSFFRRR